MRNSTRRKGTPNSGSIEERQMANKNIYAYEKPLKSIRNIYRNDGQNK